MPHKIHQQFEGIPAVPPADPSLTAPADKIVPRKIRTSFTAIEKAEGVGARVRRSIGTPRLKTLSPFLMLDHFNVTPPAGFPDHPHRGFETITLIHSGAADHEDFAGHRGTIYPGDLQFMTAGRGIVHAEMPRNLNEEENGTSADHNEPVTGMQLWVDLPQNLKYCDPRYRDLRTAEIPKASSEDGKVEVKVISGQSQGVDSVKELSYTPVWFLDVTIKPGGKLSQRLPAKWNAFTYTYEGEVTFGAGDDATTVSKYANTVFEQDGDTVEASVPGDATEDAKFIIVAGLPLDQKVVQYGPFVLTSADEIRQTLMDYQTYTNGFERARGWQSEIAKGKFH